MKYYVSPTGTKSGEGTVLKPWTLQFALEGANGKIKGLDRVILMPGEYDPVIANHNFDNYVSFEGDGDVIIKGSAAFDSIPDSQGVIVVTGSNYIFNKLHIHGNNHFRDGRVANVSGTSNGFSLLEGSNIVIIECHIENTSASGIYKSASCKDVRILNNIIRYTGHYSTSKNRYAHHGLYIQNSKDSLCEIKRNIISHPMAYGTQVWHQSGPHKQESKLIGVTLEDNIFIVHNETGLLYGGNNLSQEGIVKNNSIYPINANGLSVGYDVLGNTSYVSDFLVEGNIVNGNIRIVNPKPDPDPDERVIVRDNIAVKPGYTISIFTDDVDELDGFLENWDNNRFIATTSAPFQWVNYNNIDGRAVQEFNNSLTLDQMRLHSLPSTNTVEKSISNIIKYITVSEDRLHVAIHNFEELDEVELDLNAYFEDSDIIRIYDVENMTSPIYEGESGKIIADMRDLPQIEPIFGNIPTPDKSDDNFVALVIERIIKNNDPKPEPDTPIDPKPIEIKKINVVNEHYRVFVDDKPEDSYNIRLSEAIEAGSYIKQTNPDKIVTIKLDKGEIRIDLSE